MASSFPASLDTFTNPTSADALDSVSVPHATQHSDLNDAVEALEAKVGADSSSVTTSHDYKIAQLEAGATGGKILQVVTATLDTTASTTSTSFVDTGLSVSITPSSATSKVAVFATPLMGKDAGGHSALITLLRDSTNLIVPDTPGSRLPAYSMYPGDISGTQYQMLPVSIAWLDSPATTSATTYKVQYKTSGGNVYINRTAVDTNSAVFARGVSSIIAMEVSA